jgi:hypothetical protein
MLDPKDLPKERLTSTKEIRRIPEGPKDLRLGELSSTGLRTRDPQGNTREGD